MFKQLLLATDFSVPSMMAATAARQLATAFDSQVTLAHAIHKDGPLDHDGAAEALGILRDERFEDLYAQPLVVEGERAAYVICEAARVRSVDLIIAGRHGKHGLAERLIGTTTERIARHAPCSVYVCHPAQREQPIMFKHLLVATDLSDNARPAIVAAAAIASKLEAFVTLVHVYDLFPAAELLQEPYDLHSDPSFRGILEGKLETLRKGHFDGIPSDAVVVRNKSTVTAITDMASDKKVDLVVLGTHGLTGVSRLLLGSVAERVIRHAPCSVLVVR